MEKKPTRTNVWVVTVGMPPHAAIHGAWLWMKANGIPLPATEREWLMRAAQYNAFAATRN